MTQTTVVLPAEALELAPQVQQLEEEKKLGFVITSHERREQVAAVVSMCIAALKRADELYDADIAAANKAHKAKIAAKKQVTELFETVRAQGRSALAAYDEKVERDRKRQERELREAAEKEAADRRAAEQAELERRMNAQREAAEQAMARAAKLEEEGRKQDAEAAARAAEELEEQARESESLIAASEQEAALPVVVAPLAPAPKSAFVSTRKKWDFRVVDVAKLRPEFVLANEVAIRKIVTSLKDKAGAVVGDGSIEVFEVRV